MMELFIFLFYSLVMMGVYTADDDQNLLTVLLAVIWPFLLGYALVLALKEYDIQKP